MIHDLTSRPIQPIPQFHGNLNTYAMAIAQWLVPILAGHYSDLSNAYIVSILTQIVGDPPEPLAKKAIIWVSDGDGKGDAGDVMIAVNDGSSTKYGTLFDFSAGSAW